MASWVCDVSRYYRDNYDHDYSVEVTHCVDVDTGAEQFRLIKISGFVTSSYDPLSDFYAAHPSIASISWTYLGSDQGYSLYQKVWTVVCQEGEVSEPVECWDGSFVSKQICQDGLWTNYENCPQQPIESNMLLIGGAVAVAVVAGVLLMRRK